MQTFNNWIDFDSFWDYDQPGETEKKFRSLLPQVSSGSANHVELLTQIGRTLSLQRKFAEAHAVLDQAEALLTDEMNRARARYLLERGRTLNSAGDPTGATDYFQQAWELSRAIGEDFHAIDAAHMLAIVAPPEEQFAWNKRALDLTEKTTDQRAKKWLGSLHNNIGWSYHDQGNYQHALEHFEKALAARQMQQDNDLVQIARWCIARCLRSLGQLEEALAQQQALHAEYANIEHEDGYVCEEIGECLHALGREGEARPYFAEALRILSQDEWLAAAEPERLARLEALSASA